ncbi:MAG: preprotein translocase subunit SecA [Patescibacteria group bacterium]
MKFLDKIFGDSNEKYIKTLQPLVDTIGSFEPTLQKLSDEELAAKTNEFKQQLASGKTLDDILPESFAVVREASRRVTGMRHYDVQLIGGIILHRGQIAEMRTGEGKTLVATLPVYLNALTGKGAHLITVNDYLARRDAVWMGKIYNFLGLSVGIVQHEQAFIFDSEYTRPEVEIETKEGDTEAVAQVVTVDMDNLRPVARAEAYRADITYGTNNEFGFDYLRDNMVMEKSQKVQREMHFAIVDEVDSILIDEARTPLIISAPAEQSTQLYYQFARVVKTLEENTHYNVDEKLRASTLTDEGIDVVEKALNIKNLYTEGGIQMVHHLEQALKAEVLFKKDKDYVVKDGEIIIVDEFTGRMMHGRRYSEGLHQAIEAKENVDIQRESQTLATITFQNLFRMYEKLSGMTGTAATEAEEFHKIYKLDVSVIPTHKPIQRKDTQDSVYKTEMGKFEAMIREIRKVHETGQPILIGTASIEKNELVGQLLKQAGLPYEILNAKNHAREAEILAQAGRKGAITVATNMAGRGVDIILGGQPFDEQAYENIKSLGGLHVVGTERHESRRIDNQLRGRAGRQGDAGSTQFFLSMEDDMMRIFGSDRMKSMLTRLGVPDDMPIENGMITRQIEQAQKKIEGHNFDTRKHLVEYDDVMNKHREVVYKRRNEVLEAFDTEDSDSLREMVLELIDAEIEQVVSYHTAAKSEEAGDYDIKEIYETIQTIFPLAEEQQKEITALGEKGGKLNEAKARTEVIDYVSKLAHAKYEEAEAALIEHVGKGDDKTMRRLEKALYLRTIDTLWIEHLQAMQYLRTGIGLRGYGQRDPLVEYKKESYRMFEALMQNIQNQIVYNIYKVAEAQTLAITSPLERKGIQLSGAAKTMGPRRLGQGGQAQTPQTPRNVEKVGRNDPCPCGSGLKYKKCGMIGAPQHKG